jgi:hypothetical protein
MGEIEAGKLCRDDPFGGVKHREDKKDVGGKGEIGA